ncbi:protein of unknown function [Pseudomonas sp. JV551A1]|nr:protein of unknown function [Pseudomonas sp. JV551A1]
MCGYPPFPYKQMIPSPPPEMSPSKTDSGIGFG